jgi:hypothetical protein
MGLFRNTIKKVVLVTAVIVGKQILGKVATRIIDRGIERRHSRSGVPPKTTERPKITGH